MRHILEQGPMLRTMGGVALSLLKGPKTPAPAIAPGPWVEEHVKPRADGLIRDYVRHLGGDPAWYKGQVPAHLFPQWSLHLAARTLAATTYPVARAINAGCRLQISSPLPAGEPLVVRSRLDSVDDDGRRAIVTQRIVTGTKSVPEAIAAELRVFIPLSKKGEAKKDSPKKSAHPTVPADAREIAFFGLSREAGLDFAKLTGDFNPVHWVPAYARAAGFRSCILHGFATLGRAIEALNRTVLAGDPRRLAWIDAKFTRPLVLPAEAGVYVAERSKPAPAPSGRAGKMAPDAGASARGPREIFVGDALGGGAYLEGQFEARPHPGEGA